MAIPKTIPVRIRRRIIVICLSRATEVVRAGAFFLPKSMAIVYAFFE